MSFIDVLHTKENTHLDAFCTALEKNGYEHWAGKIRSKADEMEVSPLSVSRFLEKYEDEFLEVVNPKQGLRKLIRKGVISSDVKTAIESANDEDAKEILFEHLQKHATVVTLRVYCKVAIAANGFPRMQDLARKIVGELSPGVLTDTKCSRIRDRADNTSRVDELILNLLILLSKKNRHFGAFCTALEQNGYKHWAGKLQYKADEIEVSPLSVSRFLERYEDEFLEVVNPKQGLRKLIRKGVISSDVKTAIESANDEDAKDILFEHLQKHATVDTLRVYGKVAIAANGFPRMQELARKIMGELSPGGPKVNAPPLSQTQVQFPIIDELADDFATLVACVNIEVHSLSASRLQELKALFEEKVKSKCTPITIPSSADELINFISQYWDFLSFEFAQLVVRYLGKEYLQGQLKIYEENLRIKAEILLTHCREVNINPRAPPVCVIMTITVYKDPYSFSLHRILEFKDFLVHRVGMDMALFTGWSPGSIILHFCILEYDMETAVRQLYTHKLELRAMQVVAIEVGDVIVYRDAPIERPPSITEVSSKIDDLAAAMQTGGLIVSKAPAFGSAVSAVVENAQGFLGAAKEEVKDIPQVKTALRAVKSGAEIASCFLDKVVDIFYYCQSDAITAAIKGLSCSVPDLMPLCILIGLLGKSLAQAVTNYSELVGACNAAIHSCGEAEILCARMERESRKRKVAARGVVGTALAGGTAAAAGGVVATGVTASAIVGVFTFGIGTIVGLGITAAGITTAVATHYIASKYAKSEAEFKRIRGNFDTLLSFAFSLKGVTQIYTILENVAAQVDSILYSVDRTNVSLIRDSVTRLNTVCKASYSHTSKSRDCVRIETEELRAAFNDVY